MEAVTTACTRVVHRLDVVPLVPLHAQVGGAGVPARVPMRVALDGVSEAHPLVPPLPQPPPPRVLLACPVACHKL